MEKGISFRKDLGIAILIFLLPFASYLHLFFVDYPSDSVLQFFSVKYFDLDIDMLSYIFFYYLSFLSLYIIWWNILNEKYKPFTLFYIGLIVFQLDCFFHFTTWNSNPYIIFFAFCFILVYLTIYSNFQVWVKKSIPFKFSSGSFSLPALFFLSIFVPFSYNLFPRDTDSLHVLFFKLNANGFLDARTYLFMIVYKVGLLSSILIWFFTEKRWYKYALLSSVILIANQLYNLFWSESKQLDEFELQESGVFLFSVLLGLILISHAAHNQAKIRAFMYNRYKNVEESVANRFKTKQDYIDTKREEFNTSKTNLDELNKMKEQLEQVVNVE